MWASRGLRGEVCGRVIVCTCVYTVTVRGLGEARLGCQLLGQSFKTGMCFVMCMLCVLDVVVGLLNMLFF